jgi:hypothetical protein
MSGADSSFGVTATGDGIAAYRALQLAVRSRLKGVSDDFVESEAAWVLNEFLTRTQLIRLPQDVVLVEGEPEYALPLRYATPYLFADTLYEARIGTQPLRVGRDLVMRDSTDPESAFASGTPNTVELVDAARIRVHPLPDQEAAGRVLRVLVSVTSDPAYPKAPIPDAVMPYIETLLAGTLARLHAMDGVPWSNATLAAYFVRRFHSMMMSVRASIAQGRSVVQRPVQFRRFGV